MNFSTQLKALRKKKGLTQLEMAHKLYMEQSNYSKLETGIRKPNKAILTRVGEVFTMRK